MGNNKTRETITKQQLHSFACFIVEYNSYHTDYIHIEQRHGVNPEGMNLRQAVDAYAKHHNFELEPKMKKK